MIRSVVIVGLIAACVSFIWAILQADDKIIVSDATIVRMADGSIMVSTKIENTGDPDVLISASANGFSSVHFMGGNGPLVIPGRSNALLASDGAHLMMSGDRALSRGELVPIDLKFQNGGKLSVRAQVVDTQMDHSNMSGIEDPAIDIKIRTVDETVRTGFSGSLEISGLQLVSRPEGTKHVAGEGHAHIYLNGLKLRRLYQPQFQIGPLLPGDYVLLVSLNTNDHRPFLKNGIPVAAEERFTVK